MVIKDLRKNENLVSIIELETGDCFIDPEELAEEVYMISDFKRGLDKEYPIPVIKLSTGESDVFRNDFGVIEVEVESHIIKNKNRENE